MHHCCKFSENPSSTFQHIVLMFGTRAQTHYENDKCNASVSVCIQNSLSRQAYTAACVNV